MFYSSLVLSIRKMSYKRNYFSRSIVLILSLILAWVCAAGAFADVRLPAVMSDNMVLQRGKKVPIWGWAEPGEEVKVRGSWQWLGTSTKADKNGKWMVKVQTPKAPGPYKITITGNNAITINNVLAGEIWVCSGQSNMQWGLWTVNNAKEEIAAANYPDIRLFTVEREAALEPRRDCKGKWELCSPETVPGFSAAAYFFGRQLHKELNVPVGLIHSSWGGTCAEAWTRKETLASDADFAAVLQEHAELIANYPKAKEEYQKKLEEYQKKLEEWKKEAAEAKVQGKEKPPKPRAPAEPLNPNSPAVLYNGMIAPLIPYHIRGVIWYQGEGNAGRAYQYRKLFPAMIENWRKDWGLGDFPFYYVQIAPWKYGQKNIAAELREAQLMTLAVPNTGMAVTMDIGDVNDIHPKNKQDVGKRLALWAMAKTYGRKGIVYSGPIYKSMKIEGNKIRLFFGYVGSGLVARGGELTYFKIVGEDKKFVEAKAVIDGDTIVVSSEQVTKPVAVRFGWSNTAQPNLFNKEGLPASPFRTDDWPGVTFGKK